MQRDELQASSKERRKVKDAVIEAGNVVRAVDLKSGDPEFKPRSEHQQRLCRANWSASKDALGNNAGTEKSLHRLIISE